MRLTCALGLWPYRVRLCAPDPSTRKVNCSDQPLPACALTAEQQKNLRAQWDWSGQQLRDINRVGATDATKGTQMYRDYWTARQERLTKFLTAEQQKAWNTMIGDSDTFQPSFAPPR